jgi:hypothetical protein
MKLFVVDPDIIRHNKNPQPELSDENKHFSKKLTRPTVICKVTALYSRLSGSVHVQVDNFHPVLYKLCIEW